MKRINGIVIIEDKLPKEEPALIIMVFFLQIW